MSTHGVIDIESVLGNATPNPHFLARIITRIADATILDELGIAADTTDAIALGGADGGEQGRQEPEGSGQTAVERRNRETAEKVAKEWAEAEARNQDSAARLRERIESAIRKQKERQAEQERSRSRGRNQGPDPSDPALD